MLAIVSLHFSERNPKSQGRMSVDCRKMEFFLELVSAVTTQPLITSGVALGGSRDFTRPT